MKNIIEKLFRQKSEISNAQTARKRALGALAGMTLGAILLFCPGCSGSQPTPENPPISTPGVPALVTPAPENAANPSQLTEQQADTIMRHFLEKQKNASPQIEIVQESYFAVHATNTSKTIDAALYESRVEGVPQLNAIVLRKDEQNPQDYNQPVSFPVNAEYVKDQAGKVIGMKIIKNDTGKDMMSITYSQAYTEQDLTNIREAKQTVGITEIKVHNPYENQDLVYSTKNNFVVPGSVKVQAMPVLYKTPTPEAAPPATPKATVEVKPTVAPTATEVKSQQFDMLTEKDAKDIKLTVENGKKFLTVKGQKIEVIPIRIEWNGKITPMKSEVTDFGKNRTDYRGHQWAGYAVEQFQTHSDGSYSYALAIENKSGGVTVVRFWDANTKRGIGLYRLPSDLTTLNESYSNVAPSTLVGDLVFGQEIQTRTADWMSPAFREENKNVQGAQLIYSIFDRYSANAEKAVSMIKNGQSGIIDVSLANMIELGTVR